MQAYTFGSLKQSEYRKMGRGSSAFGMNTNELRLHRVETVADLPVLWAFVQKLDLVRRFDLHFPPTGR